jgi:hypothetical protein
VIREQGLPLPLPLEWAAEVIEAGARLMEIGLINPIGPILTISSLSHCAKSAPHNCDILSDLPAIENPQIIRIPYKT